MKRALFSALLVVCALALPATANAGSIIFDAPAANSEHTSPPLVEWQYTSSITAPPLCKVERVSPNPTVYRNSACSSPPTIVGYTLDSSNLNNLRVDWNVSSYLAGQGDGVYRVTTNANFGDTGPSGDVSVEFEIDTVVPEVNITSPANNAVFNQASGAPSFVFSGNEAGTFACSFGGPYTTCSSPFSPALADGSHSLIVSITDAAGNVGYSSPVAITLDTTPPTINLVGLGNGTVVPTPYPQYSLEAPGASSMQCFYDNNPSLTCQSISVSPTGLPDGAHTMHIIATDAAGNVATLVVSFTVDDSLAPPDQAPLPTGPRPTKVNLKKTKSTVSGSKVKTSFSGSFTIRGGGVDWNNACTGRVTVKFTGKVKGKTKSYSKRASLKRKGTSCTFKATASLPRAWKGKRVKTTVSHAGNAGIGKFAVSGRFKP